MATISLDQGERVVARGGLAVVGKQRSFLLRLIELVMFPRNWRWVVGR